MKVQKRRGWGQVSWRVVRLSWDKAVKTWGKQIEQTGGCAIKTNPEQQGSKVDAMRVTEWVHTQDQSDGHSQVLWQRLESFWWLPIICTCLHSTPHFHLGKKKRGKGGEGRGCHWVGLNGLTENKSLSKTVSQSTSLFYCNLHELSPIIFFFLCQIKNVIRTLAWCIHLKLFLKIFLFLFC